MNRYINNFKFANNVFYYVDLKKVFNDYPILEKLPNCLKILLETNIRKLDDNLVDEIINIFIERNNRRQIQFTPSRVLIQDLTAIPIIIDLATLRDEANSIGKNPNKINPLIMVDIIIDHSLNIDKSATYDSLDVNLKNEVQKNNERYELIKWASTHFENISVVPPGFGICHQINLEFLSTMISVEKIEDDIFIFPETIVGTDLHTSMINSLGVLAWEVGGIEAECIMFGSNSSLNLPTVTGVELIGEIDSTVTINDVVLSFTNFINSKENHGEFIEFYGEGVKSLSLEDRASISNMANEYNVAVSFFAVDDNTITYIEKTRGVDASLIKEYFNLQGMFNSTENLEYDEVLQFDLSEVKPIISGPNRSEEKVLVNKVPSKLKSFKSANLLKDNDIVLASIVSCLSSSNPTLIIQAALLAKNAISFGLEINTNIKKVFALGSYSVKKYLIELDLLKYFEYIGFYISGFGCASCFGKAGNLLPGIEDEIQRYNLDVSSVSSGNRNFKENVNSSIKSNWLMSPALVLAYSFKGSINCNILEDEISKGVYLKDIWPDINDVNEYLNKIESDIFIKAYGNVFLGNKYWQELDYHLGALYDWNDKSTYVHPSKFFKILNIEKIEIKRARILAILGDDILNEQISPIGEILADSISGEYLISQGINKNELDTFENRKGNIDLMSKAILSDSQLENFIVKPKEGSFTKDFDTGEIVSIYDFSSKMKNKNIPLVIFAGKRFGGGIVRDWASKGLNLLGVKAIIANSYDHNFKSNLVRVGILPLVYDEEDMDSLNLVGNEIISIKRENLIPNEKIELEISSEGKVKTLVVQSKLETDLEIEYYKNGGALPYLLKNIV